MKIFFFYVYVVCVYHKKMVVIAQACTFFENTIYLIYWEIFCWKNLSMKKWFINSLWDVRFLHIENKVMVKYFFFKTMECISWGNSSDTFLNFEDGTQGKSFGFTFDNIILRRHWMRSIISTEATSLGT